MVFFVVLCFKGQRGQWSSFDWGLVGWLTDMLDSAFRSLGPSPALCFVLRVPPSPLGAGATPDPAPRGPWRGHSLTTSQA